MARFLAYRRILAFLRLSWGKQVLLLEACMGLGVARLAVRTVSFRNIAPYLGQQQLESSDEESSERERKAKHISWAVQTMSRYTPWKSNCLAQAIAAKFMLQRRQIKSTLYLGLARANVNDLEAHAWLRCGQVILTGGAERNRFRVISTFAEVSI